MVLFKSLFSRQTLLIRSRMRYLAEGIDSLADRPRSGRPSVIEPSTVERVLRLTKERVPAESDHWSLALMAKYAETTLWQVRQIWEAAGLAPHRIKTFKISRDPAHAPRPVTPRCTARASSTHRLLPNALGVQPFNPSSGIVASAT